MRAKIIAVGCLLALPLLFQTRPAAQEAELDLTEAVGAGSVRKHSRVYAQATTWKSGVGTDWQAIGTWRIDSSSTGEEWMPDFAEGRPTQVWRSWNTIDRKLTRTMDWGNGPEDEVFEQFDQRAGNTLPYSVDAKGVRKLLIQSPDFLEPQDVQLAARERDPVPLPGKRVKQGDTWDIAELSLPLPADILPEAVTKSFKATGKLTGVVTDNNIRYATISVDGTRTSTIFERSSFDDRVAKDLTVKTTFSGTAYFAIEARRMGAFTWKGTVSVTGTEFEGKTEAASEFEETWRLAYGSVQPRNPDKPVDAPIREVVTNAHGPLAAGHVVIARQTALGARLQVFDPAKGEIVKTLLEVPGSTTISHIAVSPDRKRVSFTSNANNLISVSETNTFVFELETAKVNQITPHWASGDGLAVPIKAEKTCTLKGRIVWLDDDQRSRRDRHDGFTGSVRIDQTECFAIVKSDGTFEVTNVPSGVAVLMQIHGRVPMTYSNGTRRGGNLLASYMGATTAELTFKEGVVDLGDVRLNGYHFKGGFGASSWLDDGTLLVQHDAWTRAAEVGYAKRSFTERELTKELTFMTGGLSVARDGRVAFAYDSGGSGGVTGVRFLDKGLKHAWHLAEHAGTIDYSSQSAWLPAQTGWVCTASRDSNLANKRFGAPALFFANPKDKTHGVAASWPQLSGYSMASLAVDASGNTGYFVLRLTEGEITTGDLWAWDSSTDTLRQLTGLGDVVAVGGFGR